MTRYELTVLIILLASLSAAIFAGVLSHIFEEKASTDPLTEEYPGVDAPRENQ